MAEKDPKNSGERKVITEALAVLMSVTPKLRIDHDGNLRQDSMMWNKKRL